MVTTFKKLYILAAELGAKLGVFGGKLGAIPSQPSGHTGYMFPQSFSKIG